ncbi:uncharacterized protein PG998_006011 [Apiospora kogelbergensis]|uniref:uncharacterized protein n=1 Tax=Apiospora kogelbergensis TaxID=1337665 RepID=UPI003130D9D3
MDPASLPPPPLDVNRGPEILAVTGTLVGVTLCVVLLRIWVRLRLVRQLGWDDFFVVAAMALLFAEMMIIIPEVHYGAGRHFQYIQPPEHIAIGLHLNFATQPMCLVALTLTKVSVGVFLLRLAPTKKFRMFIHAIIAFTVLSSTAGFCKPTLVPNYKTAHQLIHMQILTSMGFHAVTVFFQCRPISFNWDNTTPGGKCIPARNLKIATYFNSILSALTDLIFALLPIPMLINVQLNWKAKSAIIGILSLGIFATAAAIAKMAYLSNYGKYGDLLFDSADITIWTTIEITVAMIAGSIPCLKPLFKKILDLSSAYRGGKSSNQRYYGQGSSHGHGRSRNSTFAHRRRTLMKSEENGRFEMFGNGVDGSRSNFVNDNSASCTVKGGQFGRNVSTAARDSDSEEYILQGIMSEVPAGITKTVHVTVENRSNYGKGADMA